MCSISHGWPEEAVTISHKKMQITTHKMGHQMDIAGTALFKNVCRQSAELQSVQSNFFLHWLHKFALLEIKNTSTKRSEEVDLPAVAVLSSKFCRRDSQNAPSWCSLEPWCGTTIIYDSVN